MSKVDYKTYARVRRSIHAKSCSRKIPYENVTKAHNDRKAMKRNKGIDVDVYICYNCLKFHLGKHLNSGLKFKDVKF